MYPTEFTPYLSFIGGIIIGISAIWLMLFHGRIAGISGIVKTALFQEDGRVWRILFVVWLVLGGAIGFHLTGFSFSYREGFPLYLIIIGGLLVGLGTSMGSGCTSGHGVCGISRISPRSIVATIVYLGVGIIVATLTSSMFL